MTLVLDREQLTLLQQHVEGTYPYEGGGWLIGRTDEQGRKVVTEIKPIRESTRDRGSAQSDFDHRSDVSRR